MNKIAQYLNEHILGEVSSAETVRKVFSKDAGILSISPEMVVSPKTTNDIRKVARFTWQLAEKGHVLPIITRGGGSDQTGASIGKGIILNMSAHLDNIIYINPKGKDQFVHAQPGVNFGTLNETLRSHGVQVPAYPTSYKFSTVGGAVANNAGGEYSGRYGLTGDYAMRLEVVLANGDTIETSRINRHELSKKQGLQTFEGEIYRKIDGIIEDNQDLSFNKITAKRDNTGYPGIAKVKGRDGSFDLTPLFVGSQGTLGIISEIQLRTDFYSDGESVIVVPFTNAEAARDVADLMIDTEPAVLDVIDSAYYETAKANFGKKYLFSETESGKNLAAVLYICYDDFNEKTRQHKLKRAIKKISKFNKDLEVYTSENCQLDDLKAVRNVSAVTMIPENKNDSLPAIIDGASIPADRREEFVLAVEELAKKHHVALPLHIQWLDGVVHTRSVLQLRQVGDKQKAFKLTCDYLEMVNKFGGSMVAESGEGRQKTSAVFEQLPKDIADIYIKIRETFDPYGTLNPGVKQPVELKYLVKDLDSDHDLGAFAKYSPRA